MLLNVTVTFAAAPDAGTGVLWLRPARPLQQLAQATYGSTISCCSPLSCARAREIISG